MKKILLRETDVLGSGLWREQAEPAGSCRENREIRQQLGSLLLKLVVMSQKAGAGEVTLTVTGHESQKQSRMVQKPMTKVPDDREQGTITKWGSQGQHLSSQNVAIPWLLQALPQTWHPGCQNVPGMPCIYCARWHLPQPSSPTSARCTYYNFWNLPLPFFLSAVVLITSHLKQFPKDWTTYFCSYRPSPSNHKSDHIVSLLEDLEHVTYNPWLKLTLMMLISC